MGFIATLRQIFRSGGAARREANVYWIYVRCGRCGEAIRGRVDLRNEPSLADDGESWIVRKGLIGSGTRRCYQTIEVTLTFDAEKREVLASEVSGGKLITEEEYEASKMSNE
jgi:hypothetical protein